MGIGDRVKKAVEQLLSDPQRAARIARVLGTVQKGREALAEGQTELLRSLQFAPTADYQRVGKQLAGLKRRVREMTARLESLPRVGGPAPAKAASKRSRSR